MGKEVAVVEHTIPLDLPKDVCLSKGYIWDETQKVCIMKIREDLKKGVSYLVRGDVYGRNTR